LYTQDQICRVPPDYVKVERGHEGMKLQPFGPDNAAKVNMTSGADSASTRQYLLMPPPKGNVAGPNGDKSTVGSGFCY
jgi:hypothetical protein